jgi:hypothetical protein
VIGGPGAFGVLVHLGRRVGIRVLVGPRLGRGRRLDRHRYGLAGGVEGAVQAIRSRLGRSGGGSGGEHDTRREGDGGERDEQAAEVTRGVMHDGSSWRGACGFASPVSPGVTNRRGSR